MTIVAVSWTVILNYFSSFRTICGMHIYYYVSLIIFKIRFVLIFLKMYHYVCGDDNL